MEKQLSILRLTEVKDRTGRSRSSIYADIKKGVFPAPIQIGERSVGWLSADITNWIEKRIQDSGVRNV